MERDRDVRSVRRGYGLEEGPEVARKGIGVVVWCGGRESYLSSNKAPQL